MSEPALPPIVDAPRDATLRRVETIISRLLRGGVLISLALMVLGTLVSFIHSHRYGSTGDDLQKLLHQGGDFPRTIGWLKDGLLQFRGQALIVLGLLILIFTPVLRVAVSVIAYMVERDRIFVLITLIVLLLLIVSFLLGGHA